MCLVCGKKFWRWDSLSEMHVANADCVFSVLSNASNVNSWIYCNDYLMWRNHDTLIPLQITIIIFFLKIHLYWGTQENGHYGKMKMPFFFGTKNLFCVTVGNFSQEDCANIVISLKRRQNSKEIATIIHWRGEHDQVNVRVWLCACLFGGRAESFLPVCSEESWNCCCQCCCQSWLIFSLIYSQPCWTRESRYTWGSYLHCINLN